MRGDPDRRHEFAIHARSDASIELSARHHDTVVQHASDLASSSLREPLKSTGPSSEESIQSVLERRFVRQMPVLRRGVDGWRTRNREQKPKDPSPSFHSSLSQFVHRRSLSQMMRLSC